LDCISTLARKLGKAAFVCGLAVLLAVTPSLAFARGPQPTATPEIDPGSALGAFSLLTGGVLLLTDRLRRK
jgi:hypothetical protein